MILRVHAQREDRVRGIRKMALTASEGGFKENQWYLDIGLTDSRTIRK